MAVPVVYEGALKGGGNLFDGMKFWVAQRIPMRSTHIEMIKSNGGQVVPLEKLADVMIADHARKDAPPGSYSWKFVAESVKTGRLENLEDHPAGPPVSAIRQVGSSRPTKATRLTFTDEDDRLLAQWVGEAKRRGLSLKGNSIYQQFEGKNPRHTYQSWRDRWIKYGQFQQRADLITGDGDHGPVRQPMPNTPTRKHSDVTTEEMASGPHPPRNIQSYGNQAPRKAIVSANAGAMSARNVRKPHVLHETSKPSPSPGNQKLLKNPPFTELHRDMLLSIYEDIVNIAEENLLEAWQAFADANPPHTAQEWYKLWTKDVKPLGAPQREEPVTHRPPDTQVKIQKPPSSIVVESANTPLGRENITPRAVASDLHRTRVPKDVFESYLKIFYEAQGSPANLKATVSGQEIQLYDLWRIVNQPEFGGFDKVNDTEKWADVAQKLSLNKFENPNAPTELYETYYLLLGDYIEGKIGWLSAHGIGEEEILGNQEILHLQGTSPAVYDKQINWKPRWRGESPTAFDDNLEIPSSPQPNLGKRGHQGTNMTDRHKRLQFDLATPKKGRGADKGKGRLMEIPSTPEDLLRFQGQVRSGRSPSADQEVSLMHGDGEGLHEDEEDVMPMRISQRKLVQVSNLKSAFKPVRKGEPETQDFYFPQRPESVASKTISVEAQDNIPGPDGGIGDQERSFHAESSVQSQTGSQQGDPEVQQTIAYYESRGYSAETVTFALLATTMETGDVKTVMDSMIRGDGIPVNMQGVWTEEDDRVVSLPQSDERYQKLVVKHTEDKCVDRRRFLSEPALKLTKWARYKNLLGS